MSLAYRDVSHSELKEVVVSGNTTELNILLKRLVIADESSFRWIKSDVRLFILGTSHAAVLDFPNGISVAHIVSCSDIESSGTSLSVSDCGKELILDDILSEYSDSFPHFSLNCTSTIEKLENSRLYNTSLPPAVLTYTYPGPGKPSTTIYIKKPETGLEITGVHTYPAENVSVHSELILKITG
ncbi:MAG: DUF2617 family protein [Deltaproteobacteria bacterium]|nr:DUF2617 family protein [Deltaproteobacteria bacterium]